MAIKLSYKEVLDYFDGLSSDMAELVLEMVHEKLEAKIERKAKQSANLKKARAARGNKSEAETQAAEATPVTEHRRPGRPARVDTTIPTRNDPNQALAARE